MDDHWLELNALRGLTPRQRRLLDLQAVFEDTHYDMLEPWHARDIHGLPLPCSMRRPEVLLGFAAEKARELVRLLSGAGAHPVLEGVEAIQPVLDQLRLMRLLPLTTLDGVVKGACALGVHRVGDASSGRWEPVYLEPEWCEPIFVAQAHSDRAAQVAEELAELGVPLTPPVAGDALFVPADAESHDLVFLRHEWIRDEDLAEVGLGQPRTTVRWRFRRDYLPNVILEYRPVRVTEQATQSPRWELAKPPRPHNWGVVPVVWARAPYAKPGDTEGPSFFSPSLLSCARKADYTETMAGDSVGKIAWPQLALIDLKDKVDQINEELRGPSGAARAQPSGSGFVLELRSTGQHQGRAEVLGISAEGPKVAAEFVERLHKRIEQVTGLVDFDQSQAAGTLSGVALERIMQPLVSTVSEWRVMVEDLLVLLCKKIGVIAKTEVSPTVRWPRILETTPQDLTAAAQALTVATGGQPVMSRETAARIFARMADVPDVEEELARLEGDAEEELARAREALSRATASRSTPTEE